MYYVCPTTNLFMHGNYANESYFIQLNYFRDQKINTILDKVRHFIRFYEISIDANIPEAVPKYAFKLIVCQSQFSLFFVDILNQPKHRSTCTRGLNLISDFPNFSVLSCRPEEGPLIEVSLNVTDEETIIVG